MGQAQGRMAALDRRRRLHRKPDAAGDRDRRIRLVDFAAEGRHRQQAGRLRIREDRDVMPRIAKAEKPARAENTALLVEIGARVRRERAKRGVTRRTLAQQCQTSERYLAQIELGEANPSVLVLDSIARALDLDPIELMPAGRMREAVGARAP